MVVSFSGWPMVRLESRSRSPSLSRAARRWNTRLSQNSVWAKNSRCRQPASSRSVGGKERREAGKPLLAATDEVAWGQFFGELLQAPRFGATDEGVGALPEVDALLAQAVGEPMMLVEIDPRREWRIGAHSD